MKIASGSEKDFKSAIYLLATGVDTGGCKNTSSLVGVDRKMSLCSNLRGQFPQYEERWLIWRHTEYNE